MTAQELARIEDAALKQCGLPLGTVITLPPRITLELVRLARIGAAVESTQGKPA